jgi:hypothetical protein
MPFALAAQAEAAALRRLGFARRGRLRSGAENRPQPRLGNAPRRFSFNIRRFGMAKLASGTDCVNDSDAPGQPMPKHGSEARRRIFRLERLAVLQIAR